MGKESSLSPFEMLEDVKQKNAEILFWQVEYHKRRLRDVESQVHEELLDAVNDIDCFFEVLFQKAPELRSELDVGRLKALQHCAEASLINPDLPYVYNSIDLRPYLAMSRLPEKIQQAILLFKEVSEEYGYFVGDLLHPANMEEIIGMIQRDEPLPEPPIFHANWYASNSFPTVLLDFIRPYPEDDPWLKVVPMQYEEAFSPRATSMRVAGLNRYADFLITAQILSSDFEIDRALETIKYEMASYIYEYKVEHGIPLKESEVLAMVECYQADIEGKYSSGHSEARAGGLWLWDQWQDDPKRSKSSFYREFKEKKIVPSRSSSSEKTISRLLDTAKLCIEQRKVLPVP